MNAELLVDVLFSGILLMGVGLLLMSLFVRDRFFLEISMAYVLYGGISVTTGVLSLVFLFMGFVVKPDASGILIVSITLVLGLTSWVVALVLQLDAIRRSL